jgi:FlaA1/EpsC-like NDP-sugar epimerase
MTTRGRRRFLYLPSAVLICLEAVLFPAALVLAAVITVVELSTEVILAAAVAYAAAGLVSMSALRLYTARGSSFPGLILRIGLALGVTAFLSSQLYDFVSKLAAASSILAATTIIAFVTIGVIRLIFDCMRNHEARQRVVLVLGAGGRASEIDRLRRRADRQGFVVLGYVVIARDQFTAVAPQLRVDVRENLLAYCQQHGVEEIVAAMDDHSHGFPLTQVNKCRDAGIAITSLGAFIERETGGIRLDALERSTRAHAGAGDRSIYGTESETISP